MTVGNEYAKAMYALGEEEGLTELLLSELSAISAALKENPSYIKLLDTPSLKKEEKLALIDSAFAGLSEYTVNMLKLLCEARAVVALDEILSEYRSLYDKAHNITRVSVITAVPMTDGQTAALKAKLSASLSSDVILDCTVDKSTLGGVILRYGGTQIDASIKARLDALSASIKNTIV